MGKLRDTQGVLDSRDKPDTEGHNPVPPKPHAEHTSQAAETVGEHPAEPPGPSAQVEPSQLLCLLVLAETGVVTGVPSPLTRGKEKISFLQNSSHQALLLQHGVRKDGWIAFSLLS